MMSLTRGPLVICLAAVLTVAGLLVALGLPNALLPRIERPEIQLFSNWPGKGSRDIEQSLVAPLERELQGLAGLQEIQSRIFDNSAVTVLTFHGDTDMQQRYFEVMSRINQVPGWPAQVARPVVVNNATGAGQTLATAMMYASVPKTPAQMIHAFKTHVVPALSKIPGVSGLNVSNNPLEQRVDIEFDPARLAEYSLTIDQVAAVLGELVDQSGDTLTLGAREYGLHFKGQMAVEELAALAVSVRGEHVIRLGELAEIHTRLAGDWNFASLNGHRALYFMLEPAPDVNALDAIDAVRTAIAALNAGPLAALDMSVNLSRDDSREIRQALALVYGSLLLGIVLACAVLYLFLREWRVVALVFVSVPVCLALVLLMMGIFGYSLNVISLAGMALSVGLLLDAAIIVVENILRLRREGLAVEAAIRQGVSEVTGAIVSSTLSSIIVFVPVLMMRSNEGQLFEDLAFTISGALLASILVALVLLPAIARYWLPAMKGWGEQRSGRWSGLLLAPLRRPVLAGMLLLAGGPLALWISLSWTPSIDVLPSPKQRILRAFIALNEPLSSEAVTRTIAQPVFARIEQQRQDNQAPAFEVYGMFCSASGCLLYFYPDEDWHFPSFKAWVESSIVHELPASRAFVSQGNLLRFAMPDSRVTQLDIKGAALPVLQSVGRDLLKQLQQQFPEANIDEDTPLDNQSARIELTPKQDRLVRLGLSRAQLNRQLVALTDGLYLGQFFAGGDSLPFYFKGRPAGHLDTLMQTQIMVPGHGLIALHQLADAELVLAPESLLRIDQEPSVSLSLTPPPGVTVGAFVAEVEQRVAEFLATDGREAVFVSYRGSADRLGAFLQEFGQMLVAALVILLLLMWLTLKSWRLAVAVMLSMPLAIAGGMLNLHLLNLFTVQNLDVITMIGFIILMGLVINNGILLAGQYEHGMRRGLSQHQAITAAVRLRLRPIYMSTATSIFGMLPLMLSPGDGAEIYRGLAAVIVGGMTFSALFSLSFMAALLSLPLFAQCGRGGADNAAGSPVAA